MTYMIKKTVCAYCNAGIQDSRGHRHGAVLMLPMGYERKVEIAVCEKCEQQHNLKGMKT